MIQLCLFLKIANWAWRGSWMAFGVHHFITASVTRMAISITRKVETSCGKGHERLQIKSPTPAATPTNPSI